MVVRSGSPPGDGEGDSTTRSVDPSSRKSLIPTSIVTRAVPRWRNGSGWYTAAPLRRLGGGDTERRRRYFFFFVVAGEVPGPVDDSPSEEGEEGDGDDAVVAVPAAGTTASLNNGRRVQFRPPPRSSAGRSRGARGRCRQKPYHPDRGTVHCATAAAALPPSGPSSQRAGDDDDESSSGRDGDDSDAASSRCDGRSLRTGRKGGNIAPAAAAALALSGLARALSSSSPPVCV
jgi:hypothetical protein